MPRPIRATVSASALAHNLAVARRYAGEAKLWAVIKANAYGHGLVRAAQALAGADGFAVLDFVEALKLRHAGVSAPILMLEGFFQPEDIALVARHRLTPVVHNAEQIEMLQKHPPEAPIDAYLKVNSGMNRLGFALDQVRVAWSALGAHPQVRSVSLMTHYADADGPAGVAAQLEWFNRLTDGLAAPRSLANSAALIRYPEALGDWVRPGIMLYGCSPFADQSAEALGLQPAMTLASEIIGVQRLNPGEGVGYGLSFKAEAEMTIGVVACGYADGYPRHAPSGTPVKVGERYAKTVGRVSMDMLCVDLTDVPEARVGTPVTLWGEGLSADDVAVSAGTLSYQLLAGLAARVPVAELP